MKLKVLIILFVTLPIVVSSQNPLKAGTAKINITPPYGTIINGDFLPNYANEIHDSLYARALAFDNGSAKFIFIVVDNMTLDARLVENARGLITEKTGLKEGQVMISNTHAHSTGAVIETATVQADMSYRIYMPGRIADAAIIALKNLQPAKIAWGHIDVPKHVACRRWYMKPGFAMINPLGEEEKVWMNPPAGSEFLDKPVSPTDPQVTFLAVKTSDDKWLSILANYSTHYVGGVPANVISADYFGEVDLMLKSKLKAGKDFVGIMSNGTSGDVNTIDFKLDKNYPSGDYEKIRVIANEITDSIVKVLGNVQYSDRPVFRVSNGEQEITRRQPSDKVLAWATEIVRTTDFTKLGTTDKASDDIRRLYALDIVKLNFYEPATYKLHLQAVRLGDGAIGTLPGEIFSETGLNLKRNSPFKYYFTVTHANGQFGYVPPAEQFRLGGYETWLCSGSLLEINAAEKLEKSLTGLIKSLK